MSDTKERANVALYAGDGHIRRLHEIEGDIIRLAVCIRGGQIAQVARDLRIGRSTLYRKLDIYGIKAEG